MSTTVTISNGKGGTTAWADLSAAERRSVSAKAKLGKRVFVGYPANAFDKWHAEVCAKADNDRTPEDKALVSRAPCAMAAHAAKKAPPPAVSAQHYGSVGGAAAAVLNVQEAPKWSVGAWVLYALELLMLLAVVVILSLLLWRALKTHKALMAAGGRPAAQATASFDDLSGNPDASAPVDGDGYQKCPFSRVHGPGHQMSYW